MSNMVLEINVFVVIRKREVCILCLLVLLVCVHDCRERYPYLLLDAKVTYLALDLI